MRLVFVSGPYTGKELINTENAIEAGLELLDLGLGVIVPHLSHYMHEVSPRPYEVWMQNDFAMLKRCDALLRLPGESPGAEREVEFATDHDIPVFFTINDLLQYYTDRDVLQEEMEFDEDFL